MPRKQNGYNKFLMMTKYEIIDEIESKALPRRMRKIGRAISARFDANALDGDGDGLVQDSTPYERPTSPTAKSQLLDAVKPSIEKSPKKPTKRSKYASLISKATNALSSQMAAIANWTIQDHPNIKTFPSRNLNQVEREIERVTRSVEALHGPINTPREAIAALKNHFKDVSLPPKIFAQLDRDLTPTEKNLIYSIIDNARHAPHLKNFKLSINDSPGIWPSGSTGFSLRGPGGWQDYDLMPATIVEPFIEIRGTLDPDSYRNVRKDVATASIDANGMPQVNVIPNSEIIDSVGTQLSKLVYDQGDASTPDYEKKRLNDVAMAIHQIDLMNHEMAHAISESQAYLDAHKPGETLAQIEGAAFQDVINDVADYAMSSFAKTIAALVRDAGSTYANSQQIDADFNNAYNTIKTSIAQVRQALNSNPTLSEQLLLTAQMKSLQDALTEAKARWNQYQDIKALGERIVDQNHPLMYFVVPFDTSHPLHGQDIDFEQFPNKDYRKREVVDALIALITDDIIPDLKRHPLYIESFDASDPIEEISDSAGNVTYNLDIIKSLSASSPYGRDMLQNITMIAKGYRMWDGIKDINDQKELLAFVRQFSRYGSKRPRYLFPHDTKSMLPQEIYAEMWSFLKFGNGIQDLNIPPTTKQLIIKWLDWSYGSRGAWKNALPQVTLDALGV